MDTDDVDMLAETYNSVLSVLAKHAALKKKTVFVHPRYTDKTTTVTKERSRKAVETATGLTGHREIYNEVRTKPAEL